MPSQDFIDVRIYVDGQPLVEYLNSDGENGADQQMTRYIEAKAGQKFVVQVTFLPGFEFRFASHIQVASQVDQDGTRDTQSMAYEDVETIKGMLQKPQIRSISHRAFKDPATGMWYCYDFVFGALAVHDDVAPPKDLSAAQVDLIGSISVSVSRCKQQKLAKPYIWHGEVKQPMDEISERALKGKSIKNNIKFVPNSAGLPYSPFAPQTHENVPIKGKHGKPYKFTHFCTGTKSLGCIPRSPSPPPDAMLMLQRTEDMLRMTKQRARQQEQAYNSQMTRMEERLSWAEALIRAGSESNPTSRASTAVPSVECNANMPLIGERCASVAVAGNKRKHAHLDDDTEADNAAKRVRSETMNASSTIHGLGITGAGSMATLSRVDEDDDVLEGMAPPPKPKVFIDLTDD